MTGNLPTGRPPLRVALELSCAMEPPLTGVGYVALFQARALAALGEALDLRLFATPGPGGGSLPAGLEDAFTRRFVAPRARRLKQYLWTRLNGPPIEWCCGACDVAHGFFHLLPAARRAKRLVTIHDVSFIRHPEMHLPETVRLHTEMVGHAVAQADALVAVSQHGKRELIETFDVEASRIHVVPNGIDTREFEVEFDAGRHRALSEALDLAGPYLVHLGTIEPRKNLPRLIEAYAHARAHFAQGPKLLLIGKEGWMSRATFEAIERFQVQGDVVHVGHLPRADALLLLRGAMACVYPSLYEGFGLPPLEAMAARVPVITSNVTSLPEVVGDHATLIDPHSVESIESALVELFADPTLAHARLDAAQAHARGMSWARSAARLLEVYRAVVQGAQPAA